MIIRVCDDDPTSAETWVDNIRQAVGGDHSVERLEEPLGAIQALVDRKKAAGDNGAFDFGDPTPFDEIDVLVADYDLIHIDDGGNRTTGEGVARLAKAYSRCGLIVVLNQFSKVDFDLSMTGHLVSWADVNVDARSIGEPALWRPVAEGEPFAPSYWSPLLQVADARKALTEKLAANLEIGVLASLDLHPEDLAGISDQAFAFLSEQAKSLPELAGVTVRTFLRQHLGSKDADPLMASPPDFAARLAASRIAKWLDRAVLRPLDAMADAAHLLERRPFLADASPQELEDPAWWADIRGVEGDKVRAIVAQARLEIVSGLLDRSVFGMPRLEANVEITALLDAWDFAPTADVVFAEDTSRFIPRDAAEEFRAGFGNFNDRRFVEKLGEKTYGPIRRFAFAD
jgi:hypothetical protein